MRRLVRTCDRLEAPHCHMQAKVRMQRSVDVLPMLWRLGMRSSVKTSDDGGRRGLSSRLLSHRRPQGANVAVHAQRSPSQKVVS